MYAPVPLGAKMKCIIWQHVIFHQYCVNMIMTSLYCHLAPRMVSDGVAEDEVLELTSYGVAKNSNVRLLSY